MVPGGGGPPVGVLRRSPPPGSPVAVSVRHHQPRWVPLPPGGGPGNTLHGHIRFRARGPPGALRRQ
eukprot:331681-Prorocentrum_minimum.AAC.1